MNEDFLLKMLEQRAMELHESLTALEVEDELYPKLDKELREVIEAYNKREAELNKISVDQAKLDEEAMQHEAEKQERLKTFSLKVGEVILETAVAGVGLGLKTWMQERWNKRYLLFEHYGYLKSNSFREWRNKSDK